MPDLVDKAEAELSQIMMRVSSMAVRTAGQTAVKMSVKVGQDVKDRSVKAAAAMWGHLHPEQGKVSLKTFSEMTDGKRGVVNLDDIAVSREFERELKRHGVTWSVEHHRDGAATFHVEGKDTELIQHALGVAAARVDERVARGAPEMRQEDTPEQDVPEETREQAPERDAGAARDGHGTDELREDAPVRNSVADSAPQHDQDLELPRRDEAVADLGGHSQQGEVPTRTAERPPRQLSPRDETREKVAKRIDHEVKQKKDEARHVKTRTKTHTRGRDDVTDGRPPKRGR